ncbi:MAG TPA: hypothetical protein P5277_00270 [Candidatus Paceibacterota bacterium]|nr:hypothetical protein [Candidatus Paceibacterota bacterium]
MKKKKAQSDNLISRLDLEVLKALDKKSGYGVVELRNKLKINPLSARRHINRLQELKLIERKRIEKTNRAVLNISEYGKQLLELFDKILKD